ncbi:hypothetical protein M885DRAFT_500310 [Pelagophyceae sp. CCMP2097]|nr:hypothetical protein M885DRAFT_500310 [Pelagophyceae sp. CCMP2097]
MAKAAAGDIEKEPAGSRGDNSGQRAAHKRVAKMMGTKADDASATLRQVRNAEGKMLYGREAAEFIAAQYEERQRYDPERMHFCAQDALLRKAEWEGDVRCGDVLPSAEDIGAYGAAPVQLWEVERVASKMKKDISANPEDGVALDPIINEGTALYLVLARLCDLRRDSPWDRTPVNYKTLLATLIFKGKGRDKTSWLSYRFIMLLSFLAKVDEGVMLFRLVTCVGVDESQSVANEGVDARHQLHIINDFAALARAQQNELILAILDVERGFPSCEREDVYLALFRLGVRAHLIEGLAALDFGAVVRIKMALYRYTESIPTGSGILEGSQGSPDKFSFQIASLAKNLRTSPYGAEHMGRPAGALIHMDDIAMLPRSGPQSAPEGWPMSPPAETPAQPTGVAALRKMLDGTFEWLWRHGHRAAPDKLEFVLLAMAEEHGPPILDYCWLPSEAQEPDCERRAKALASLRTVIKRDGVKLLGYLMGTDATGHTKRQYGVTLGLVRNIEGRAFARIYLSIRQALWSWTVYALPHATWAQAVSPRVLQERALKALLGKAIGPVARINYDLLLSVFRLWRLKDRRELDRVLYYYHSERARRRPWRKEIIWKFEESAREQTALGAEFRRTSPAATILLAINAVEILKTTEARSQLQHQRQPSTDSSEASEADDQSSSSSDEQLLGESSEASSYDSDDSSVDSASDDDDPLGHRMQARRLGAKAKGLLGREAARLRKLGLCRVESAALFNEMNPSGRWLRKLAGSSRADEAGLSVPAMLVGAFWPCAQIRCSGRPRRCPCGYTGPNLMLHFIFGKASDGIACTVACQERADFERRITRRFEDADLGWQVGASDGLSIRKLARWLGGGGQRMPQQLAEGLPHDFIATFGEYARRARVDGVLGEMVKEATASTNQQTGAAPAGDPDGEMEDPEEESEDDDDDNHAVPSHDDASHYVFAP